MLLQSSRFYKYRIKSQADSLAELWGRTDKVACRGRTEDSILILGLYTIQEYSRKEVFLESSEGLG